MSHTFCQTLYFINVYYDIGIDKRHSPSVEHKRWVLWWDQDRRWRCQIHRWGSQGTFIALAICSAPLEPISFPRRSMFWIVLFSYQKKKKRKINDISKKIYTSDHWYEVLPRHTQNTIHTYGQLCVDFSHTEMYRKWSLMMQNAQVNTSLQKLNLYGNAIGHEGAKAIGQALQVPWASQQWI